MKKIHGKAHLRLMKIVNDLKTKGFSIVKYYCIDFGIRQNYLTKIHTKKQTASFYTN